MTKSFAFRGYVGQVTGTGNCDRYKKVCGVVVFALVHYD